jgi:hypothetical protein
LKQIDLLYAHVLHMAVPYGFRRRKCKAYNTKRQKLFYVQKLIFL